MATHGETLYGINISSHLLLSFTTTWHTVLINKTDKEQGYSKWLSGF